MKSIIRRTKVQQLTGLSGSTIYRKYKAGDFPQPIRLGANSVGWYEQVSRYLVIDFGTSQSPKSTRQRDSQYAPAALRPLRSAPNAIPDSQ